VTFPTTESQDEASREARVQHAQSAVAERGGVEVLFLGGVFPEDEEPGILARSRGPVQNAANALQWTLIRGLDAALGAPIKLLNAVFVGSYPRLYRDIWIRGRRWSHAPGARDDSIGFLNVFGVKHLWRTLSLARSACRWAASRSGVGRRSIVIYSMHMPFMVAAAMAKSVDRSMRVCMIVPDLPEHMNLSGECTWVLRALKAMDRRIIDWAVKRIDAFVLLTQHMAEPLGVGNRPWLVMEGAIHPDVLPDRRGDANPGPEKIVLYSGTLHKAYGILQLLEAFALVPDRSCRLWICGAGEAEREVRELSERDERVRFLGQVSRGEVLSLQRRANVLVNPRDDAGEFTKYSFPSKLLEYLLSGTPAIVRRLPGVPEEYFQYLFVVEGASSADLARTICEVVSKSPEERAQFGERARRFVVEHKSGLTQARRILGLIDSVRPTAD
jgi:glycosyltransferase involved in cell wall biosynthesis